MTQKFVQYIGIPKDVFQRLNIKKHEHFVRMQEKGIFYVVSIQLYGSELWVNKNVTLQKQDGLNMSPTPQIVIKPNH